MLINNFQARGITLTSNEGARAAVTQRARASLKKAVFGWQRSLRCIGARPVQKSARCHVREPYDRYRPLVYLLEVN